MKRINHPVGARLLGGVRASRLEPARRVQRLGPFALFLASALFAAPFATAARFRGFSGWIPTGGGGDVATLPNGTTVADAQAACAANALCLGFTYEGPVAGPSNGTLYLKNASACELFFPYAPSHWSSWLKVLGPCDAVAGSAPCVAAFSTVRALYGAYDGALYQLNRSSDGAVVDIGVAAASPGIADAAAHDAFCAGAPQCFITRLYDQSPQGNDLVVAPTNARHVAPGRDVPVNASDLPITVSGWKAYGMRFGPGNGYRNARNTTGVALGNEPEVIYFVVDGARSNGACCFDFGASSSSSRPPLSSPYHHASPTLPAGVAFATCAPYPSHSPYRTPRLSSEITATARWSPCTGAQAQDGRTASARAPGQVPTANDTSARSLPKTHPSPY